MSLSEKLMSDMKDALRAKDERRLSAIRFLRSQIKNREIEKGEALKDEEIVALIQKNIKQRKEVFPDYERTNRQDLLKKEKKEIAALEPYLPPQLSEDELRTMVDEVVKETGASAIKDTGKVMGALMTRVKGKADGKVVSDFVKQRLQQLQQGKQKEEQKK